MARSRRDVWAKRVERWGASGLTAKEFARRRGLSERALRWWKWHLRSTGHEASMQVRAARPAVSPVTFVEMTNAISREPVEVVLGNGVRIRIPADFDASTVERVLDMLERRR